MKETHHVYRPLLLSAAFGPLCVRSSNTSVCVSAAVQFLRRNAQPRISSTMATAGNGRESKTVRISHLFSCSSLTENHSFTHFPCLYEQCARQDIAFARKADLERHMSSMHNRETLQLHDCQLPGCHRRGEYGFTRKDKMIDHMRDVHKVPIPKRANGRKSESPTSSTGS